jgi:hypothetical protein
MPKRDSTYRVYVIEIADGGPHRNPELPWVYVGQSSLSPYERLKKHEAGGRLSSRWVRGRSRGLRWDLFQHPPVFRTQENAIRAERRLRQELLDKGYSVKGGELGFFGAHIE